MGFNKGSGFGSGGGGGGGGGVVETYNNSGDNRVLTSVNSTTINGETTLLYDASTLSSSAGIQFVGGAIFGNTLNVTGAATFADNLTGTKVSASVGVSGAAGQFGSIKLGGADITATATELNQLDGLTLGSMAAANTGDYAALAGATFAGAVKGTSFSGSSTLEAVGATTLGSTLGVTGSATFRHSASIFTSNALTSTPGAAFTIEAKSHGDLDQDDNLQALFRDTTENGFVRIGFQSRENGASSYDLSKTWLMAARGRAGATNSYYNFYYQELGASPLSLRGDGQATFHKNIIVGNGATGGISGSGGLEIVGDTVLGSTLKVTGGVELESTILVGSTITTMGQISSSAGLEIVGNSILGGNISVSGNVGIGTSSPQYKVDIPNMGGLILAYNQITGSRDGTGKEVLIGLASQLRGSLSNWTVQHEPGNPTDGSQLKITFTMPASERVEVSIPTGIGIVAGVMGRDADDQMWYPSYAEQQAALTASNQPAGRDKWRLDSMAFHFSLSENSASYVPAGDRNLMEKCALYYDNTATGMGHLNPTPWVITG